MARPHGGAMSDSVRDVIIIGSGPAGYTAGLYTARAMLNPLMFAGYASGGQLMLTTDVENFPGYPTGVSGPEMMVQLREQAERFGLEVHDKDVTSINTATRPFEVEVEGTIHRARSLIISTGLKRVGWMLKAKRSRRDGVSRPARPVMGRSSGTIMSSSLEAVIQRWRKPRS